MHDNKIIGILGGMGPAATVDLFNSIIKNTPAIKDQDHLPIFIYNNPKIPDRSDAILRNGESPVPYLISGAKILEQAGADFILIPCNTSHFFLPEVTSHVGVPFIDMIDNTFTFIKNLSPNIFRIGLLATEGTIKSGIYRQYADKLEYDLISPSEHDQKLINECIYSIKAGRYGDEITNTLKGVVKSLISLGSQAVILGCTELPLIINTQSLYNIPVFNPTELLAIRAVNLALEHVYDTSGKNVF